MPRVLLCVQNMPVPRDPRVWREARSLAGAGYEVTVVSPGDGGLPRFERLDGVTIVRFPTLPDPGGPVGLVLESLNALFWTAATAIRLRCRGRLDVLHAANPPDTFFLVGLLLRPFGTRFIFDQHDPSPELGMVKWGRRPVLIHLLQALEQLSYRSAHAVLVANGSLREFALNRGNVPTERVVVIRNGPDRTSASVRRSGSGSRPLMVTYAGVMGRQDGCELLLEAAARVDRARPGRIRIDMIGDGDDVPRLKIRARELGVEHLTDWAGWLTGDAYVTRLQAADIAVSPDPDDSLSRVCTMIKVTEYIAAGIPAVVADLPESRVSAGRAARYFHAGDPDDLAARLVELIDRPQAMVELSLLAAERAPGLLWSHSGQRLLEVYAWLLNRAPAPAAEQVVA